MPRDISIRAKVVIVPSRRIDGADREVEIRATEIFVEYPDDTTGDALDDILRAVRDIARPTETPTA